MQGNKPHTWVSLFDHLVSEREQRRRYFEAERLGSLEVDHELEFGGLHNRQVGGFGAFEDFAGVDAALTSSVDRAGAVAQQATCRCELTREVHYRDCMAGCERHDLIAATTEERIVRDDQCTGALLDKGRECRVDVVRRGGPHDIDLLPDHSSRFLKLA